MSVLVQPEPYALFDPNAPRHLPVRRFTPAIANSIHDWLVALRDRNNATPDSIFVESNGTDDTAAISDALARAKTTGREVVLAGPEFYAGPIEMRDFQGVKVRGLGPRTTAGEFPAPGRPGTLVRWLGDNQTPMFLLNGCRECLLEDLSISTKAGGANLIAAIRMQNASGSEISSHNTFRRVNVMGIWNDAHVINGFETVPGSSDVVNDLHEFQSCSAYHFAGAAWNLTGVQSVLHRMVQCVGGSWGYRGTMVRAAGSNFRWYGGTIAGNKIDFDLESVSGGGVYIYDLHSEQSTMFLRTGNEPSNASPILVQGGIWISGWMTDEFNYRVIDCKSRALTLSHWGIAGNQQARVHFENSGYQPNLFHVDSTYFVVGNGDATEEYLFTGQKPSNHKGMHIYGNPAGPNGGAYFVPARSGAGASALAGDEWIKAQGDAGRLYFASPTTDNGSTHIRGLMPDVAGAAVTIFNAGVLSAGGTKILSLGHGGGEKAFVDKDGSLWLDGAVVADDYLYAPGAVLKAPNGTNYRVTVDNAGALVVTPV